MVVERKNAKRRSNGNGRVGLSKSKRVAAIASVYLHIYLCFEGVLLLSFAWHSLRLADEMLARNRRLLGSASSREM